MAQLPARVRLVIFDLDGVIYRGHEPIAGARELVAWLHSTRTLVRFATNNSTVARAGYVDRLAAHGIRASEDEIVTSTSATIEHLRRHAPEVRRVLGIGADGMRQELDAAGFDVVMSGDVAPTPSGAPISGFDAVLVGLDPELGYARLAAGMAAVAGGARLIATNADARYPTADGFAPGAGAIVNALATATGVEPDVIGKPSPAMFLAIMEASGVPPEASVVVGDNPSADVAGAHRAGCSAILVLTGVADRAMAEGLEGERAPDAIADDPAAVRELLADRLS
ncbi:MAG TPA: HAD-IIA family hydrolase [Candidatus Limnocylindria bacterium]